MRRCAAFKVMQFLGYNLARTPLQESGGTTTYAAERQHDRVAVLIKRLSQAVPTGLSLSRLQNEYAITQILDCPGIVRSLAQLPDDPAFALVLERPGTMSLEDYQQRRSVQGSGDRQANPGLTIFLSVAVQLAKVLGYLESQRVIHQAIHPGNIWINPDTLHVTLINFEQASRLPKEVESLPRLDDFVGRLGYISPEQTGRTSRGIDYRTDFYSLGVVFYQLLTGRLPFELSDPAALLYAHLAQMPRPPHRVKSTIPVVLSDLVMKLLAKDPAARYQSAKGLLHDLAWCNWAWQGDRQIPSFKLASHDRHDRFTIAATLYGRTAEVDQLLLQFYQISHHRQKALVMISGDSGVGKTAIVNQVQPQIARQRGYFCRGKFDQLHRHLPLSAVVYALRDLLHQWLTQTDQQLAYWREKLLAALGHEAQVMVALLPELNQIIGPQPPVPRLTGEAAGHRFNLVLLRLIRAIAQPQHPLVLFLDDLQWADGASVTLIQRLLLDHHLGHLLLIGAYRDHEVSATHRLTQVRQTLQAEAVPIVDLRVRPLPADAINQMVADTLHCSVAHAAPLGTEIWRRTQGNPFFSRQMFTAFYDDRFIHYNAQSHGWQCDLVKIGQTPLADEVVGFMVDRLQKLAPATRSLLSLAACIGNHFDLATLAMVADQSALTTGQTLWPALQLGLLLPTHQTYRFYQPADPVPLVGIDAGIDPAVVTYQFLHDRVQQAAYALIDAADRPMTHLRMGRRLRDQLQGQLGQRSLTDVLSHDSSDADDNAHAALAHRIWQYDRPILEVINQLNQGIALIDQPAERIELAALNLTAGRRALTATAYQMALSHATTGIGLLSAMAWSAHYDLNLALHELAAAAAYLCGEFGQTAQLVATVQQWSRSILDTILICDIQIKAHIAAGQPQAAVQFGWKTLRQLGIRLPQQPNQWQAGWALVRTRLLLWQHSPTQIAQLPLMTDARAIAIAKILQPITYIALLAQPRLMPVCALTSIQLALRFGNSVNLAYAYTCYGALLCSVWGDFKAGSQMGQLALASLDVCQNQAAAPQIQVALAIFIDHWQMPFRQIVAMMRSVHQTSLATGQIEMAAWALHTRSYNQYYGGMNLVTLAQEVGEYAEMVRQFNQFAILRFINATQYVVALWRGNAAQLMNPLGLPYDPDQCLVEALAVKNWTEVFIHYTYRSLKQTIAGEAAQAYADLQKAAAYLDALGSLASVPLFYYSFGLSAAACADTATVPQLRQLRRTIQRSLKYLQTAAAQCPDNYAAKFHLVQAEWYRLKGDRAAAIAAYDRAITLAQAHQMPSDLAQANELAGRFYRQWQQPTIAQVYMIQAYQAYVEWGAIAKVDNLLQTYPDLLASCCPPPAVTVEIRPNPILLSPEALSLKNAMQAARAISSEIELTPLLETLMRTVLQESGADRGVLLLGQSGRRQADRLGLDRRQIDRPQSIQWQIYIDTTDMQAPLVFDPPRLISLDDGGSNQLPNAMLQYVGHTQEVLIINASDFAPDRIAFDQPALPLFTFQLADYFQHCQPQSMLGLPIVRQQQLVGILYLENRHLEGVFSHDRVELLQLLCAQAAIAIANAQLYQRNQSYTQRLEQTQTQMLQLQSKLLDETLHDPLTGLFNRAWFTQRLTWLLQSHRANPAQFYAVLLMDLDRFKVVNDSLGHLVGDQLLQAVALRLQSCLASPASISRLGGDEFVILLEDVADHDDAIALAESILAQFSLAFTIADYEIYSNASIGITTSDTTYYNPEDVLRDADTALYAAKDRHKGSYMIFNQALERSAKERLHLENDLRQAIAQSQSPDALAPLYLHYQPIYDLPSRAIMGVEALVRWEHPIVGAISPLKFIPIAEETGLIKTLGPWILATACGQLAQWAAQGNLPEGFTLHVNCSALQFHQVDWLAQIKTILQQTQINPAQLKLEITENCLLDLVDVQPGALTALKDLGIRLCIDDFGVGYSSLSRLLTLPIDTIKIDRSFVEDFLENADQQAMVNMILTLAQTLKMEVVAEGIQTLAAIEYLQAHGCQLGQSFFLSHPVAADRIAALF